MVSKLLIISSIVICASFLASGCKSESADSEHAIGSTSEVTQPTAQPGDGSQKAMPQRSAPPAPDFSGVSNEDAEKRVGSALNGK